jgi:aminoglycoside/choline kinase family phosphotransferase
MSHYPTPQTGPRATSADFAPVTWADPAREAAFHTWLAPLAAQHGLQVPSLRLASADASFRRYLRVDGQAVSVGSVGRSWIIMDAPPDKENCQPFVHVAGLMAKAGLAVPHITAWDAPLGFMLTSDLGADTMMAVVQAAAPPEYRTDPAYQFWPRPAPSAAVEAMYRQAVDALITWQLASQPGVLPDYDAPLLYRELSLFPDWYLGAHRGIDVNAPGWAAHKKTLDDAFGLIVATNLAAPSVYVHRDFMPRNLMVMESSGASGGDLASAAVPASAPTTLGVLDFQDAVYGPVTYDIACLMRDAFLTWDESFVIDVTVRYWQKARQAGLLDFEDWADNFGAFYRSVEWMGLQRHLKVAGIFARLTLRDGKPQYLADTPRFIAYIRQTTGRYRELKPLMRLIEEVEGIKPEISYSLGRAG